MNIFRNTKFEKAEEDRLTNALMCLLEHCDRSVLNGFLALATGGNSNVSSDEAVQFDIQVTFSRSRPDARIETNELQLVIETKRGEKLDEEQWRNHWDELADTDKRTVLLALTDGRPGNSLVDQVNRDRTNESRSARHLTWPQVLQELETLEKAHPPDTVTGYLLRQMGEYLGHLGYDYFRGLKMDDIKEYASAIARVAKHRATTRRQMRNLLLSLGERINGHVDEPVFDWKINTFGEINAGRDGEAEVVSFDFLDCPLGPKERNQQIRVLPYMRLPDDLRIKCYLTFSRGAQKYEQVTKWLDANKADISRQLGPDTWIGLWQGYIYHIRREITLSPDDPLLLGDDDATNALAKDVATFFMEVRQIMEKASQAT